MRKGQNPNKNKRFDNSKYIHQVVIPVYIPNQEDYFKDSLKILKICLESLIKTSHSKIFISVVNNGSCLMVSKYLNELYEEGKIQELIHTDNIGKSNAILKGVKGHYFNYITIADADVLFLNHWQEETMKVFQAFPKAGVVGLIPQIKMHGYLSTNIMFDYFFSRRLRFKKVINPDAMKAFYKSLGWGDDYNQNFLKWHLTLKGKNNLTAVVGAGHVVSTYKREALNIDNNMLIDELLGPKILKQILDFPVLRAGGYRLTTEKNLAFHMGNTIEPWMNETLMNINNSNDIIPDYSYKPLKNNRLAYFIKNQLFRKLLENKTILHWFISFKGLPRELINGSWHE